VYQDFILITYGFLEIKAIMKIR